MANYYCYWDIRSQPDFYLSLANILIALALATQIGLAYRRARTYLHPSSLFYVYYFLAGWYIAYNIEYLYGAIVYRTQFVDGDGEIDEVAVSVVFEVMDFFPAFLLCGCLFFAAYHLLHRIHTTCENLNIKPTKWQLKFYSILKKYQLFRILYLGPTLTLLFVQDNPENLSLCSKLQLMLYLLDSALCNVALLISLRTLRHKNQLLNLSNDQQRNKLRRESVLLQIAGICRFVMGLTFIFVSSFNQDQDEGTCFTGSPIRTWMYMLAGQSIMHFMPVIVILSIFRISSEEISVMDGRSSLLVSHLKTQSSETANVTQQYGEKKEKGGN